jgi:uncharacterized protein YdeI (YjbR/CyaY-like superfamily)
MTDGTYHDDRTVPVDFFTHLHKTPNAIDAFKQLPKEDRIEFIRYIEEERDPARRIKRIQKVIQRLLKR